MLELKKELARESVNSFCDLRLFLLRYNFVRMDKMIPAVICQGTEEPWYIPVIYFAVKPTFY